MTQRFPVRAVAGCFALAAFSVAIISGLAAEKSTTSILEIGLLSLIGGQVLGYGFAQLLNVAVRECLAQYEREHPILVGTDDAEDSGAEIAPEIDAQYAEAA